MAPAPPPPPVLTWADAPARIRAAAEAALAGRTTAVIGVTGPVGAGKTSLARLLSPCVVSTDSYLPDYDAVEYAARDRAEVADLARLASDLARLRRGETARVPVWSHVTHRREGEREVSPARLVVCEGIHALHAAAREHLDVAVYVDAPAAVRWRRWERIELAGERGMGVEEARRFFDQVAEPTFAAAEYRARADFVVINAGE